MLEMKCEWNINGAREAAADPGDVDTLEVQTLDLEPQELVKTNLTQMKKVVLRKRMMS